MTAEPTWKRSGWLIGISLLAIACWATIRAHLFFVNPPVWLCVDEGYAAALAIRLFDGTHLPYVDGISIRGPLMYWIFAIALKIGGPFNIEAIRIGAMASSLAIVLSVWSVPAALGSPLAGGFAAMFTVWSLSVGWPPVDGLAWNGESIGMPFAVTSVTLAILALRSDRSRATWFLLVASGALASMAVFVKQSLAVHILWTAVCILVAGPATTAKRLSRFAVFLAGAAVVTLFVLLPYMWTGHLGDFWYYFIQYGRDVYMAPVTFGDVMNVFNKGIIHRSPFNVLFMISGLAVLVRVFAPTSGNRNRTAAVWWLLVLGHSILAVPSSIFTGRFFGHYFLQVDTFVSILIATTVFGLFAPPRTPRRTSSLRGLAAVAGIAFVPILFIGQSRTSEAFRSSEWFRLMMNPAQEPVASWIREHTDADDRIFVWGLRGDIYVNAQRRPASRFVYSLFPSGVVPWYREPLLVQQSRVVPGSQRLLLSDLDESHCKIIVDAGHSLLQRYMVQYPLLRTYIEENYELAHIISVSGEEMKSFQIPLYRRKEANGILRALPPNGAR